MLHIAVMIENANAAVTEIEVQNKRVLMEILKSADLSQEQKLKVIELLKPLEAAIKTAQSKFCYDV